MQASMAKLGNDSILDTILAHKRSSELPQRKQQRPLAEVRQQAEAAHEPRDFAAALQRPDGRVALIAEVKHASPSKGDLVTGEFRPVALAQCYETNGAAAISVLTDERFFKGSLEHLTRVKEAVRIPVLRKDFIIDEYQLYEARAAGADAALLIVAALDQRALADLHALAMELRLTPLVEVHDESETEQALQIGAQVIGVNNRDLRTFVTDINVTGRCASVILDSGRRAADGRPHAVDHYSSIIISESGIFTADDVANVAGMGARAILVGESIITSGDIPAQVRALSGISYLAS
jgi:indole-3-glycerol phosphate synthase